ncbi:hypothetical protein Bca52824_037117 [Brassica carinata]|uniref:Uncharacterized protein n=1 Tax=Brassica carinata TaxID=52824 RepID=A0A8X7V254_BRACI|nr:hypothetical protein Bca52824_037117 [Brassica carinata]
MTKKKKAKHGLSGRGASASPSSSSSNQSPGVNKQASSKTPAIPPSLKLDLAAAVSDGSVDLPSDLPLESRATVETSTDVLGLSEIEAPTDGHLPALDKGKGIDYPAVPPVKTPAKVYRPKSIINLR